VDVLGADVRGVGSWTVVAAVLGGSLSVRDPLVGGLVGGVLVGELLGERAGELVLVGGLVPVVAPVVTPGVAGSELALASTPVAPVRFTSSGADRLTTAARIRQALMNHSGLFILEPGSAVRDGSDARSLAPRGVRGWPRTGR
jgi:hypothetical protein